jgi:nucleoside permease NupC
VIFNAIHVISFVALADLIDRLIHLITHLIANGIGVKGSFGLNQILGVFMYPFALLFPAAKTESPRNEKNGCLSVW